MSDQSLYCSYLIDTSPMKVMVIYPPLVTLASVICLSGTVGLSHHWTVVVSVSFRYGSTNVGLSKLVPHIVKLMDDQSIPVSVSAIFECIIISSCGRNAWFLRWMICIIYVSCE